MTKLLPADPPNHKRRCFQFSLRTLLIGVTLLAAACAYVGWQAKIVRERNDALTWLAGLNCQINTPIDTTESMRKESSFKPCTTWIRRLLGDQEVILIVARPTQRLSDEEIERLRQIFPGVVTGHEAR
jgi:hypothetical protein